MKSRLPDLQPLPVLDERIPDWDIHRFKRRACPICNALGTPRYKRPDGLTVNRCSRCGTYFISPAPNAAQLGKFYSTYFSRHRREELRLHINDSLLVREMLALNPAEDEKARVLGSLIDLRGKRTLDVGFGMGQMMVLLRTLGADIHGIDLDPDSIAFARDRLRLTTVRRCDLGDLPRAERFDLITLHDLIEHPLTPMDILREAVERLRPGGLLSLWTPNATFVEEEEAPVAFRVDLEHMQYFSMQTCAFISQTLPLELIHLQCTGTPRLEQLAWLSGNVSISRRMLRVVRRSVAHLPRVTALTAIRRRLISRPGSPGTYHLFSVFRKTR